MRTAAVLVVSLTALVATTRVPVWAQSDAKPLVFEVASIKPNKSGNSQVNFGSQPGGRFIATNVSLMDAIRMAYGTAGPFPLNRVVGGASWLSSDRFDIVAKSDGDPTMEHLQLMVRSLLAERFKLTVHNETRERPIYTLVAARSDGRLGPGLKHSDVNCSDPSSSCELKNLPGHIAATAIPIQALIRNLVGWTDDRREIRDETGLSGNFEVTLDWAPIQTPQRLPDGVVAPSTDPLGPSLFTALQEQLGLKLQPGKDESDVLVIDHAEQPTPD